jgi:hypothetical protein
MIQMILAFAILVLGVANVIADEAGSIRKLLTDTFDKPDLRLVVDPVVVSGEYAIAGWSQGEMGGRALMRRRKGEWSLILCSGDGIKSPAALTQAGLPSPAAQTLSRILADAEKNLPVERLALFARFEGTVMMDSGGAHPPSSHK